MSIRLPRHVDTSLGEMSSQPYVNFDADWVKIWVLHIWRVPIQPCVGLSGTVSIDPVP